MKGENDWEPQMPDSESIVVAREMFGDALDSLTDVRNYIRSTELTDQQRDALASAAQRVVDLAHGCVRT